MRRFITVFLTIFICFLLQTTVFKALAFGGISPNLLIVVTAAIGFMRGDKNGIIVGFFCGLLIDIFYGDMIGFYALIYAYVGFINGAFTRIFYPEDMKLPLLLITLSDITYGAAFYVFRYLLQGKFYFSYYFMHIIVPEAVYTVLISIILYPLILRIHKWLAARDGNGLEFV